MQKKTRINVWVCVAILFLISVNWFYPYSFLSVQKTLSFDADNIVVEAYTEELNDFAKNYEFSPEFNLTTERTQYILQMYEQEWLISKKPVKLKMNDLEAIIMEVKETREILLELAFRETYSHETKDYLKASLKSCLDLEERIQYLQNSQNNSRSTLTRQFRNIQGEFISNFDLYTSFYESYKSDLLEK
ncbi:hypothetical protein ACFVP8_17540 [Viridibacillus arvi]|uniref:hypothetical protein n=1 Tax=Viridibacillus arvi TaxID=263475 RepID=UPI0036C8D946